MGFENSRLVCVVAACALWPGEAFAQEGAPSSSFPPAPPAGQAAEPPAPEPPAAQPYPAPPPPAGGQPAPGAQTYPPPPPPAGAQPQYLPPGHTHPPPPASYPPPPASYPPPPAYERPREPTPEPRYPRDAATRASPFFDATLTGIFAEERFSDAMVFGAQVGGYVAGWLRLSARLGIFSAVEDVLGYDYISGGGSSSGYYEYKSVDALPSILYGASVGMVAVRRTSFVFSPGFMLSRVDMTDHGTLIGVSLPFEWVMSGGARIGFEAGIGRAIGGTVTYQCSGGDCSGRGPIEHEREPGVMFMLAFQFGFGVGYPKPEEPSAK